MDRVRIGRQKAAPVRVRRHTSSLSNQFHATAKGTPHERRDHVVAVGRVLLGCLDNRLLARLDWTTFSASSC
jgi:hypothetical protein